MTSWREALPQGPEANNNCCYWINRKGAQNGKGAQRNDSRERSRSRSRRNRAPSTSR